MDENELALNEQGEENSSTESPTEEQTAEEPVANEFAPSLPESVREAIDETVEEPKKGAQARIRELNQKAKLAEERARSLEERLAEVTKPVGFQGTQIPQFNPQEPIVADGEEISVAELNKRIAAREQSILSQADARAELRQRQSEAVSRINNEAGEVVRNYPELDPDSEDFNKELSDSITEATEAYIRSNPYSASVKTFVAKLMKPYKGAVTREAGQVRENIAKQASQTALRPTSVSKQEKTAGEKSIAELEQELGLVQS
jgi:hypothetical protein